eukprot:jgi/Chrzof1/13267/Cz07g26240.t1
MHECERSSHAYVHRQLLLTHTSSGASYTLDHYEVSSWPDHGTPTSSAGIRDVCKMLAPIRTSGLPVVVHCSAGIGRTGTFCAIDITLQRLAAWNIEQQQSSEAGELPAAVTPTATSHQQATTQHTRTGQALKQQHLASSLTRNEALPAASASTQQLVEGTLDLPALVHQLREQRMGMVQTYEQYVFAYKAILEELAQLVSC